MELRGYEVVRLKPEIPRFAELVRGAKQICDSFLGKGLYSERQIDEICRRENCYFFTVLEGDKIEGIFYCYADRGGLGLLCRRDRRTDGRYQDRCGSVRGPEKRSKAKRTLCGNAGSCYRDFVREEKVKLILLWHGCRGKKYRPGSIWKDADITF